MANYPQIDDCSGIWKLKDVKRAVMGGYWRSAAGGTSRGLFIGGDESPAASNVIDFVTIASIGNAADFGDLTVARGNHCFVSEAHGGLNEGYQGTRIAPIPRGLGVGQRALQAGGFSGGQTTIEEFNSFKDPEALFLGLAYNSKPSFDRISLR